MNALLKSFNIYIYLKKLIIKFIFIIKNEIIKKNIFKINKYIKKNVFFLLLRKNLN